MLTSVRPDAEGTPSMPPPSPTVALMEFGIRVKARRRELGISAKAVSDYLSVTPNFLSTVENSKATLSSRKLDLLAEILQLGESEMAELRELVSTARTPGWWAKYSSIIGDDMSRFCGLEHGAERIQVYEGKVVTGLLQTRDYAEAMVRAAPNVAAVDVSNVVELRLRRQARLHEPDPAQLLVLLSEAALHQQIGTAEILREQLLYLAEMIEKLEESLEVRVQQFATTPQGLITASTVVLLDFPSPHLRSAVWREAGIPVGVTDDQETVRIFKLNFSQALASSLGPADSLALIRQRAEELGGTRS